MKQERITSQKQIILDYLRSVKIHPSAEKIYKEVKKKLPRISMGTVYRNLDRFSHDGDILTVSGKVKRFDGDITPHSHFICEKCGKIFDMFNKIVKINLRRAKKAGSVNDCQIYIYGKCKKCS